MQYTRLTTAEQSELMSALAHMPVFLHQHDTSHVAEIQAWHRHAGIEPAGAATSR